jgi:L,D-transpeptidase YcbB
MRWLLLTNGHSAVRERTAADHLVAVSRELGSGMGYRMRSHLGMSLVAATLVLVPIALSFAAYAEDGVDEPQLAGKKKPTPLKPATITGNVTTETEIVTAKNAGPMLAESSAATLQGLRQRYVDIEANGGFPKVPKGTYKKGAQNKGVAFLNRRLFMDGYLRKEALDPQYIDRVTSATVDAVTRFQRNMGLAATGLVDGPTLAAMNVPASARIATIDANIPRFEVYAQDLGDRYLVVNIPAQQIETVNGGKVFSRHNAIVGRPERPTPVVMTALSDINFNPYWNAPVSIVENDIFPKLRSGTRILTDMNMKVFQGVGGPEIDPDNVRWSSAIADNYHFRQEPGPANAMATAKINFTSPFGIYLHDTPEKQLFKSGERLFSSGCVRVEKVDLLMEWILNGQDGIGSPEITALAETLERRDVKLIDPPQLRIAYLTAWPVGNTVAFRRDVYGLDGTGFTVGQPLPEGETSEDGLRFVLKPVPRKLASVDAEEAGGFGLFGKSRTNKSTKPRFNGSGGLFGSNENEDGVGNPQPAPKKLPFAKKQADGSVGPGLVKQNDKAKKLGSRKVPGLFDWAAYRKGQKSTLKNPTKVTEKKVKNKVGKKPQIVEAAITAPKPNVAAATVKKDVPKLAPKANTKVAATEATDVKKPAIAATVKTAKPDATVKKVVASTPDVAAKKPVPDAAKKPATSPPKLAAACKPDAKDCKPAVKKAAAAN